MRGMGFLALLFIAAVALFAYIAWAGARLMIEEAAAAPPAAAPATAPAAEGAP